MKAGFRKQNVPEFLAFATQYATPQTLDSARLGLRVLANCYNRQSVFNDTLHLNLPAVSTILNLISRNLEKDYKCTFFVDNNINFNNLQSYEDAMKAIQAFQNAQNSPYIQKITNYITSDLPKILHVILTCKATQKPRSSHFDPDKESKIPLIKELKEYPFLMLDYGNSAVLNRKNNAPVVNAHRILKQCIQKNAISEEVLNKIHGYLENILINGWMFYYRKITIGFCHGDKSPVYSTILNKLETIGENIFNVSLIGRHNRQISAIDDNAIICEEHLNMLEEIRGFIGNVYSLFLAYNYLTNVVQFKTLSQDYIEEHVYTWTCGFCSRKLGSATPSIPHHTIMIDDLDGIPHKAECSGVKHPPIEVGNSALTIKAKMANAHYENACLELEILNTTQSLLVVGKYADRIFTPRDLSWNARLEKSKKEKKVIVDQLKKVRDDLKTELKKWKPVEASSVPVWNGMIKKKVA